MKTISQIITQLMILVLLESASICLSADPAPAPVPEAAAKTPVAEITVTDSLGMPLPFNNEVDFGQQIVISSAKAVHSKKPGSLVWITEPKLDQYEIPVGMVDASGKEVDAKIIATTPKQKDYPNGLVISIMQIVSSGDRIAWQKISLKCGLGPIPPPGPGPGPGPTPPVPPVPPVPPTPTAKHLMMAVVYDDQHLQSADVQVRQATKMWDQFREDGDDFRYFNGIATNENLGKKAVADAQAKAIPWPALVIYEKESGRLLDAIPCPKTVDAMRATRTKYKSGVQQ